jgi:uncharacterized protein involved in outer membrane biogenesis
MARPRARRAPHRRLWIVLAIIAAAFVLLAVLWDWNWLKGPIERRVSERTGRTLTIAGDLDVELGVPVRVHVHDVSYANPDWAQRPQMLHVDSADFSIRVMRLLRGQVVLPAVRLTGPDVDLEKDAHGANNWTFAGKTADQPGAQPGNVPVIGTLAVESGRLRYVDPQKRTRIDAEVATLTDDAGTPAMKVHATGEYEGQKLDAEGTGGGILSIADSNQPFPLDARFAIGPTHGTVAGTVTGLIAMVAADLNLDLRGESLADLFPLIKVALPATPPYHIRGRVLRQGATWRMNDFAGGVGDSDLEGSAAVTFHDKRPYFEAKLQSKLLDLDDLGGLIGAPPQTGPGETASPKQRQEAAQQKAKPMVLPDKPFDLTRLRAMDADIVFTGKSIRGRTALDDLELHAIIDHGVLTAKPLNFGVAGGNVISNIGIDGRGDELTSDAGVEFRRIDMHKLFPNSKMGKQSVGVIGGRANLKLHGKSFAELVGHASGSLGLATGGGQVSNLLLELLGLDAAETLRRLFKGDKPVTLRCAVADFGLDDGLMQTRSLVMDTSDTNVTAEGRINLRDESLDLKVTPLPKDYSPLALRGPLHVSGTFKQWHVRPEAETLARGGIAIILGALLTPVAALIPLIETGPGDDVDCERLIQAVQRHAGSGKSGP